MENFIASPNCNGISWTRRRVLSTTHINVLQSLDVSQKPQNIPQVSQLLISEHITDLGWRSRIFFQKKTPVQHIHRIHVWNMNQYEWLISKVNVGKYTWILWDRTKLLRECAPLLPMPSMQHVPLHFEWPGKKNGIQTYVFHVFYRPFEGWMACLLANI